MTTNLFKRLAALEDARPSGSIRFTPAEAIEAARRYEDTLRDDHPLTPEAEVYFGAVTLKQIASDYDAMLKGASAPWE